MNQFNNWFYQFHQFHHSWSAYSSRLAGRLSAGSRAGRSRTAGWTYCANWSMSAATELRHLVDLETRFGRTQS